MSVYKSKGSVNTNKINEKRTLSRVQIGHLLILITSSILGKNTRAQSILDDIYPNFEEKIIPLIVKMFQNISRREPWGFCLQS